MGGGRRQELSVGAKLRLDDVIGHSLRGMSHMNQENRKAQFYWEFPSSLDHGGNQALDGVTYGVCYGLVWY